jgi:N-glycosylase/DNA lyase
VQRDHQPVTVERVRQAHQARRKEIRARLAAFAEIWRSGTDALLWEELAFCIFTAGASARMGLRSIEAVRPLLIEGGREEMTRALVEAGAHRFPVARPGYLVVTRDYLREYCGMRLREALSGFADPITRRDWLAQERRIKGMRYKEASHFLRNIGLKGYGILDKHVLRCLTDLGVVESPKPPATRAHYVAVEENLRRFACDVRIDFDELDLVLWSMKTGEVLK